MLFWLFRTFLQSLFISNATNPPFTLGLRVKGDKRARLTSFPRQEGTEKVDYTVYIWYNVSIKYRRCFYDRTTAEIDAKSIHGNI